MGAGKVVGETELVLQRLCAFDVGEVETRRLPTRPQPDKSISPGYNYCSTVRKMLKFSSILAPGLGITISKMTSTNLHMHIASAVFSFGPLV